MTASSTQKIHFQFCFALTGSVLSRTQHSVHHKWATAAAAMASDARNCAVSKVVFQAEDPDTNFSGTTNTSPGCIFVFITPPENRSEVPPADTTEPFARMM